MSAFVLDKAHIDALVTAAIDGCSRLDGDLRWYFGNPLRSNEATRETSGRVGAMLWAENMRSVNARYREDGWEEPYIYTRSARALTPVEVFKALHCYEYQSCESDDWTDTEAHAFCRALERRYIHKLPGYDTADWEIVSA